MAAPLTNFKAAGEDISDTYVDTDTVLSNLNGAIPSTWLSEDGLNEIVNRSLWSWGLNSSGELGANSVVPRSSPVQLGTASEWFKVVASNGFSMGIKPNGSLWTWGIGSVGNLGSNAIANRSSPVQVGALTNWSSFGLISGLTSFAIKSDGSLWSWGRNVDGVLGQSTAATVGRSSPVQVGTLTDWKQISSAEFVTQQPLNPPNFIRRQVGVALAVKTDGTLWAWGAPFLTTFFSADSSTSFTQSGTLGLNDTIARSSPVQVGTLTNWKSVSVGGAAATVIALKTDGTLWSWGIGGALGQNDNIARSSPVQIGTSNDWKQAMATAIGPVFAIKNDGSLWAWGPNTNGYLGLNDVEDRSSPVQVGTLTDWRYVSNRFAIKTDGTLWGWGSNTNGVLGDNSVIARSSPVQIGTLSDWKHVSGISHTLALK